MSLAAIERAEKLFKLSGIEELFKKRVKESFVQDLNINFDSAHDYLHIKRVVKIAKNLCKLEKAKLEIVLPAAWLHDLFLVLKDDPRRSQASVLSAKFAIEFLESIHYPEKHFDEIRHAIETHSFSAKIKPVTLEAKIVQDADRLDGIGAIGIARCFATGALLKRPFYFEDDPFSQKRESDDKKASLDHFFVKLLKISDSLFTVSAREEGKKRAERMAIFLDALKDEIL